MPRTVSGTDCCGTLIGFNLRTCTPDLALAMAQGMEWGRAGGFKEGVMEWPPVRKYCNTPPTATTPQSTLTAVEDDEEGEPDWPLTVAQSGPVPRPQDRKGGTR
ncbi:hypothetical protein SK128_020387 [Halocaridina rubra]|uniref:Uncharacterized protein n=1 Tax=Halocaridina rubra TaxID=373956 RepID=A0AAN8WCD2_HALRR